MKVLIIDVNCKYSSTGNIAYNELNYLKKGGHEAILCYGRGEKCVEEDTFKFGIDFETIIHAGLARVIGWNGVFSPISTKRLIKKIDSFKPDIIHIHELHAYFVNIKRLLEHIKKSGIKTVMTLHCEYDYTGKCGHANDCTGYKKGCGKCPRLRDYPSSILFDQTANMYQMKKLIFDRWNVFLTVPSEWMLKRVRESFLKNKRIQVIYNGLNTELFTISDKSKDIRKKYNIEKNKKILLGVAPDITSESKGGVWMKTIATMMKDKVHLLLIGANRDEKISENIDLISSIKKQEILREYYSTADIFLLCSKRETFSMTCLEALACGTPVVGFKCGAPETVFKPPYAIFVEYGDVEAMVKSIEYRLNNLIDPKEVREYAINNFSEEKMNESYEHIFKGAVNGEKNKYDCL